MDWQVYFDNEFPEGLSVTAVADVPEHTADSPKFLTPRVIVTSDDETHPSVRVQVFEFEKDVSFKVQKIEDFSPGVKLVHSESGQQYLLSGNLDPMVHRRLKKARKEWYGI